MLVAARTQLRKIADEMLETTFDTLESRVIQARSVKAGVDGGSQISRTREVLERDRALASAAVCDEPIRTRTMAQLLAAQGHPDRALSIYRYLLASNPGNASLQPEITALEAAVAQQTLQG